MKRFSTALLVLLMVSLLNGCSEQNDSTGSITGSGDDSAQTAQVVGSQGNLAQALKWVNIDTTKILWKPRADTGGKLVVLLPRSYGRPSVAVTDTTGKVIESGRFVYFSNPNRATYRFTREGRKFPNGSLLKVGSKYYQVSNTAIRHD